VSETNEQVSIIVADDHHLVRQGLVTQLQAVSDFTVVGDAENAEQALKLALERKPDVVLLDIEMPGIVVSAYLTDEYLNQALKVGAKGYVMKNAPFGELVEAIREAMASRAHFSEDVRSRMTEAPETVAAGSPAKTRLSSLTPRERELLRMLAAGVSLKEAARQLNVSYKTADNQRTRLMKKLEIHDRVELARFAIREGIIQP
jgi:DNA-binding NarL/FixJ family response regulator